MRIAMIAALWGPALPTGSGIYAYELAKRLATEGHEVHVFTSSEGKFNGTKYPQDLHLHVLHSYGRMWEMNPLVNLLPPLLEHDFDIVHVHSYIFFMSNIAAFARGLRDFRYVLQFHGGMSHCAQADFSSSRMWMKEKVFDPTLGAFTVSMADRVLSVSRKDIPIIEKKFRVPCGHLPNAISVEDFSPQGECEDTVTYVGKLERWKGVENLVKVFHLIYRERPHTKFMVVGDGSMAELLRSSGLPITMMPHVSHDFMPRVYSNSTVTVLPSFMEGSPTICLESLACGTPVVATNVGDTPDLVLDGRTGYIDEPEDVNGMAEHIIELLDSERQRRMMGAAGRKHVVENYSYDRILHNVIDIYEDLGRIRR